MIAYHAVTFFAPNALKNIFLNFHFIIIIISSWLIHPYFVSSKILKDFKNNQVLPNSTIGYQKGYGRLDLKLSIPNGFLEVGWNVKNVATDSAD